MCQKVVNLDKMSDLVRPSASTDDQEIVIGEKVGSVVRGAMVVFWQ